MMLQTDLTGYKLRPHQYAGLEVIERRSGNAGLFMDRGTGKTRIALAHVRLHGFDRVLVVAPLWVVGVWTDVELPKLPFDDYRVLDATDGSVHNRYDAVRTQASQDRQFIIVGYESYWREPLRSALIAWDPEVVILDEAHRIRYRGTKQTRFAHLLARRPGIVSRLALTGSLIESGWEDIYSIYKFIDPSGSLLPNTWLEFENEYLIRGGYLGKAIVGYRNEAYLEQVLAETSFRVTKEQALPYLPPREDVVVPVELSPASQRAYTDMAKLSLAEVQGTDSSGRPLAGMVLARITLTNVLRLQQITSGIATTANGLITFSDDKLSACTDLVADCLYGGDKVAIFCRFRRDVERIGEQLKGRRVGYIIGGVTRDDRRKVMSDLHNGRLDVVVCQIKAASLGIDLTPCSVGIFYSTGFSLDDFDQAQDRLHREGQRRRVIYYHLLATLKGRQTVDHRVFNLLHNKRNIAQAIIQDPTLNLEMFAL